MAGYDAYGVGDDKIAEESDRGFIGFNNRLRPDQLPKGMLQESNNARLDINGQWQVRKGVDNKLAPFAVSGTALRLPAESDSTSLLLPHTITNATASSGTITLTTNEAHNLSVGDTVEVNDIVSNGDNVNGSHTTIAGTTASTLKYTVGSSSPTLTVTEGANLVLGTSTIRFTPEDFTTGTPPKFLPSGGAVIFNDSAVSEVTCGCKFSDPNTVAEEEYILLASNSKVVAYNTTSEETFDINLKTGETIPLESDIIQVFNKSIIFRDGQAALENKLFFEPKDIFSVVTSSGDGTTTVTTFSNHNLITGDFIEITGAPNISSTVVIGQYTITKTGNTTFTYTASSGTDNGTSDLSATSAFVKPLFNVVPTGTYTQPQVISTAAKDNAFINNVFTVVNSADVSVGQRITCLDNSNNTSGLFETIGNDQVNFIAERTERARFTVKEVFESASAVGGGVSSSPGIVRSTSTLTITTNSAHGLKINQPIAIASSGVSQYNGNNVVASVPSSISFTVELASASGADDTSGSATVTPQAGFSFLVQEDQKQSIKTQANVRASGCSFQRTVSEGLGFTHMPAAPFGAYHNKRLVVPYRYEVLDSGITFRNIKDEVLLSDLLDSDTYDQIFSQFRFNAGSADFVVGFQSFANDQLIIFNRNSIHTVFNTVNLSTASVKQVTDEVGCLARKSIEQIGSEVLFLSDNGVYGISFVDEYNLRGTALPLSEPINSTISRINQEYASNACSAYFDNRYYLAVPIDGSITNNAIIIYNFLNKQWESIDTVDDANFDILELIVAGKGLNRAVYAINSLGGIHMLDVNESGQDAVITTIGSTSAESKDVLAKARTRQFTFTDIDRKKWRDFEVQCESNGVPTDFTISANTENIDQEGIQLGTLHSLNGNEDLPANESVSIRGRIGNKRAYGIDLQFDNTKGRPKLRAVEVSGGITFNSDFKAI